MEEKVLVLRCCNSDGTSHRGFRWPVSGLSVECSDWDSKPKCGNGLHGWLWGAGDPSVCDYDHRSTKTLWLVVEVLKSDIVDLGGKVKFPRGNVVYRGDRETAVKMIADKAPQGTAVMFQTLVGGSRSKLAAGDYSKISAGHSSHLIAGDNSTCEVKANSTVVCGYRTIVTAGRDSFIMCKNLSTVNCGNNAGCSISVGSCVNVTAGDFTKVIANNELNFVGGACSTVIAGNRSKINVGTFSIVTCGDESVITAGAGSTIKYNAIVANVKSKPDLQAGELEAGVQYRTVIQYSKESFGGVVYKFIKVSQ